LSHLAFPSLTGTAYGAPANPEISVVLHINPAIWKTIAATGFGSLNLAETLRSYKTAPRKMFDGG
jgi:hypothetical protein